MAPPWFVADHDATEAPTAVAGGDSASTPIFAERERPRASVEEAVDTATTLIFDERAAANSGEEKPQASADGAADSASTLVVAERAAKFKHAPCHRRGSHRQRVDARSRLLALPPRRCRRACLRRERGAACHRRAAHVGLHSEWAVRPAGAHASTLGWMARGRLVTQLRHSRPCRLGRVSPGGQGKLGRGAKWRQSLSER